MVSHSSLTRFCPGANGYREYGISHDALKLDMVTFGEECGNDDQVLEMQCARG
jgi:hypothetical protein